MSPRQARNSAKPGKASVSSTADRIARVLTYFGRQRRPVAVSDVAEALGMPLSTASRLTSSLAELGFLKRAPDGDKYVLGALLVVLGRAALQQRSLEVVARPTLEDLALKTGEGASLGVLHESRLVYLMYVPSGETLGFGVAPGQTVSAHTAAMGKVLLANLPHDDQTDLVNSIDFSARTTPRSIPSASALAEHLRKVSEDGFAVDDEETQIGVRCVAAPIFDEMGRVVAAVSTSGWTSRVTYDRIPALDLAVREAALKISHELGYVKDGYIDESSFVAHGRSIDEPFI